MEIVEKNVVENEVKILTKNDERFINLLRKICNDFKVDNYKIEIEQFLKNR